MLWVEVSEIHAYPSRPKGYEEPLFPTAASKRALGEHLLRAPWLMRASELRRRTGQAAHILEEPVELRNSFVGMEYVGLPKPLIKGGFLDALMDRSSVRTRLLEEIEVLPKKRSRKQPEILLPHPASWWMAREMRNVEHMPLTESQRESSEWEVLALNVFRHPLSTYRAVLRDSGVTPSERIKELPHGTRARAAGLFECLQCPPTKSGHPVWFLVVEDEWGLLQATIFRDVYDRYGDLLHHRGAFLLEGRVENTPEKGFSFLVQHVEDLRDILSGAGVPTPKAVSAPGAFLRIGRQGKRAG